MKNGIYHSAEGSTWTKKNHKYIRKEGNRYIYPEDVKNGRRVGGGPIRRTKNKTARDILSEKGIRNVRYEDYPEYNRVSNSLEPSVRRHRNTITKDKDGNYRNTINYKGYDGSVRTAEMPGTENFRYSDERKEKSDQYKKDFSNMWIKPAQNYLKNGNPVAKRLDRNAQRKALIDQANHRKAIDQLHDNRGFKKNQSMYYDDRGVRKTERPKYDTVYDDRGIRKSHNTLTYQIPEKKEDKNFFERKKEEFEKASADRKWEREKKSIKKSNTKELKKRQRNRRIEAGKKVLRDLKNKFSVNKIKEEPDRPKEPYIDENGNKVIPMNESYYYDKKAKKMRRIVK